MHIQESQGPERRLDANWELPSQFRQELDEQIEKELQRINDMMRYRINEIVTNISQKLFETYATEATATTSATNTTQMASTDGSTWCPAPGYHGRTVTWDLDTEPWDPFTTPGPHAGEATPKRFQSPDSLPMIDVINELDLDLAGIGGDYNPFETERTHPEVFWEVPGS